MTYCKKRWLSRCGYMSIGLLFSAVLASPQGTVGYVGMNASPAVRTAAPNRVDASADWSQTLTLQNHFPLWANSQNDAGPATAEMALTMVLERSPEQQAALEQLLADQKNPSSPDYHHWLTPEEFGARFGLSDTDLQVIRTWIETQGLRVTYVAPGRNFIGFGGSPAAVGRAFGTQIHNYSVNGNLRVAPTTAPRIPAPLATVVKSIRGLYTVEERPSHQRIDPQVGRPQLSLSNGSNFIVPADFKTIYDGAAPASGYGQTIGIVGRSRTDFDDFRQFNTLTSAALQLPKEVVPVAFGGVDPGPAYTAAPAQGVSIAEQSEATLDVTRAGSVAPNASLLLVVASTSSGGIGVDAQYMVQTTPVPVQVMNISYGACESAAGKAAVQFWDTLFQQAAAEGISVFVSSGDAGASGCETAFAQPQSNPRAISPNYICSSSYATCVGGTEFNDAANPSQYWGLNGPGESSARGYIPEGGWNEPLSNSTPQVAASGGGVSSFISTPSWQKGPGVPSARSGRYTPDVSFSASCHDGYFACMAAAGGSCVPDNQGTFHFVGFCGTSASAPSMAGVAALLDENKGGPQGNLNPDIYAMAQNQPSSFHDATPASSGVQNCDLNTPSMCNNSTPGPAGLAGGQQGYALTTGYDLVTGVGSPDIVNFIANYGGTGLPVIAQGSIALSASNVTIAAPGATTGNTAIITITPVGGFTGNVDLTAKVTSSPSGADYLPTVTFGATTPVAITGAGAVTATLTIGTTAPATAALVPPAGPHHNWIAGSGTALAFLVLIGIPARSRRKASAWFAVLLLLVAVAATATGCSSTNLGSQPPATSSTVGTTPGTYTVTITATPEGAPSAASTTTLKVVVQ